MTKVWAARITLGSYLLSSLTFARTSTQATAQPVNRLLNWVTPNWVDTTSGESQEGKDKKNKSANGNGDQTIVGLASAVGAGQNTADQKNYFFNENASNIMSGQGGSQPPGEGIPPRGGEPPPIENGNGGSASIAFPKWYPVCVFIDALNASKGNEIVKGMVDMAAKCRVNYVVFPFTVNTGSYPDEFSTINTKQQASCNLGPYIGVANWSTTIASKSETAAGKMCGLTKPTDDPTSVAGCAVIGAGAGGAGKAGSASAATNGNGGTAKGGAMESILQMSGGSNSGVAMHEVGHNHGFVNEGEPPEATPAGLGLADPDVKRPKDQQKGPGPGGEGSNAKGGYNDIGCAKLQATAYANDGRWTYDRSQTVYYVPEMDPSRQIMLGEPIFGKEPPSGPPGPPIIAGPDFRNNLTDEKEYFFSEKSKEGSVPPIGAPPPPVDDRHKKRPSAIDQLVAAINEFDPKKPPPDEKLEGIDGEYPPEKGKPKDSASYRYDETVKKGEESAGANGAGGATKYFNANSVNSDGDYGPEPSSDDSTASSSEPSSGSGGSSGGAGGEGESSSYTYNEDIPKGGQGQSQVKGNGSSERGGIDSQSASFQELNEALGNTKIINPGKGKKKKEEEDGPEDEFFKKKSSVVIIQKRTKGSALRGNQTRGIASTPDTTSPAASSATSISGP